ncbi:MAG TPA: glycosyltransferase 87 family protein, partial [Candidatus Baltobacteraceae bacterium]
MRVAALAALMLAAGYCGFLVMRAPDRGAFDFQAFYCAGAAVREHADPYRTQPLGACEHRQTRGSYAALPPDVVLPAPQPGYDVAPFALLSFLPFATAKAVWGAALAIALALAIVAAYGATRARAGTVVMALIASLVFPALAFGQIFAIFAAAACAAMFFAATQRWSAAGIAAAISLVEPHFGLPLCAALFVLRPQARVALAAAIAALAVTALAVLGVHANVEYVTSVVPLHALAELGSDAQLGVPTLLHAAGVPARIALLCGMLVYAAAVVVGVALGGVLASHTRVDALVAAGPVAFAVMGAAFVHVTEVFAAVPLALLLASMRTRRRSLFAAALVFLSVPWYMALERGNAIAFAVLGAAVVTYLAWRTAKNPYAAAAAGALAFALLFAVPHIPVPL